MPSLWQPSTSITIRALALAATTALGGCATTWPDISVPPATRHQQPRAEELALIIAIEDYEHLADIPGARANARAIATWLREARGLRPTRVRLIRDADATAKRIERAVAHAVDEIGPGGRLWVVFIGHGMTRRRLVDGEPTNSGVLLTVDAPRDAMQLATAGVLYPDLMNAVSSVEHVIVLDACFSGVDRRGEPLAEGLQPVVWTRIDAGPRGVTLTASTGLQFAGQLPKGDVPAFSYLWAGSLRGWADLDRDGRVSAAEAEKWSREALGTADTGREQHPTLIGDGALVLAEDATEAPPPLDDIERPEPLGPWLTVGLGLAALGGGLAMYALNQEAKDAFDARPSADGATRVQTYYGLTAAGYALGGLAVLGGLGWRFGGTF